MSDARLDAALAVLALSLAFFAVQRTRGVAHAGSVPAPVIARASALPPLAQADSLADAEAMLVENDVFRLANRPASVPFTLTPLPTVPDPLRSPAPREPRPNLVLRAIMGGPPWLAVVDGLPDQGKGVTVRAGDTFGRLIIQSVGRDTVVVQGSDTTWKLTISRDP